MHFHQVLIDRFKMSVFIVFVYSSLLLSLYNESCDAGTVSVIFHAINTVANTKSVCSAKHAWSFVINSE